MTNTPRRGFLPPPKPRTAAVLTEEDRQAESDRFTSSLAGMAVAVFLAVIGLYVMEQLAAQSKLEDCLLQGRMNCERIQLSPPVELPS
jgi:hypothetical protein